MTQPLLLPMPLISRPEQLVNSVGRLLAELREDVRVGVHGYAKKIAAQQVEIKQEGDLPQVATGNARSPAVAGPNSCSCGPPVQVSKGSQHRYPQRLTLAVPPSIVRRSWLVPGWSAVTLGVVMRQVRMPSGRAFIGARLRRLLLVGVGVAALSLAFAPSALANTTIGNTPAWTPAAGISGNYGVSQFVSGSLSYPTPTAGQTVTIPAPDTMLDSFTFYVDLPSDVTFRGEVYAWTPGTTNPSDPYAMGSATGGQVWQSGPMNTTSFGKCFNMHAVTFNTGGVNLNANTQYVLFITTSADTAANASVTDTGCLGVTPPSWQGGIDTYTGGDWVYQDDQGMPSNWTTLGWTHPALFPGCVPGPCFGGEDLGFTATFSSPLPTNIAQCKNGGWKTYGFKNQGQCVSFVNTGKHPPSGP
jgi:hypothetical protein